MSNSATPPADDPDATLKPPQFTLRALLIGTTGVAALLAVLMAVGTVWAVAVLFFVSLVAAHVVGNAIGTRLRDRAVTRPEAVPRPRAARPVTIETIATAPTRLAQHRRLHWIILVLAATGAFGAAYFGGSALAASYPEATTAAQIVAYVSSGVLGGLVVFIVGGFMMVLRQAISDAHAASDSHRPPQWKSSNPSATALGQPPVESLD